MRIISKIFLLLLISMFVVKSHAQTSLRMPQAKADLDTTLLLIGDHVTLQIDVEDYDSAFVQFPVYTDTIIKNVEILKDLPFDTIDDNGRSIIRKRYVLTSFDSGYYYINPVAVMLRYKSNVVDTIYTNPLFFGVQTIQIDSAETRVADIKLPLDTPLTIKEFFHEYMPYLIIIVIALIIVFLVLWLLKNRKRKVVEIVEEIPKEEAHVYALRELDLLSEKKYWQRGQIKDYYSKLSEILRRYLELRYEIMALESSTTDISQILKVKKVIEKELQTKLLEFLETADLVKFAKFEPLASEHIKYLEQAYDFVLKTKIEAIPEPEEVDSQNDESGKLI